LNPAGEELTGRRLEGEGGGKRQGIVREGGEGGDGRGVRRNVAAFKNIFEKR